MSELMTDELREFIELARADTGQDQLEQAWVSAFRSFLTQTSRDQLASAKHRMSAREQANDSRIGEAWSERELDLAFNPNYTYTQVAQHLGRTPESVISARKRYRKQRRDRLQELTDIIDGKYD